jgi:hypothetical protein
VFWPNSASAHYAKRKGYVGSIRITKNWIRPKRRQSTKCPTDTDDRKFMGEIEKKGLQQQLPSKRCKMLDGKDQKRAEVH